MSELSGWERFFDGAEHELVLGRDWEPMDWTVDADGNRRDLSEDEERRYGVANGWAVTSIQLQSLAKCMGGSCKAWAVGDRHYFQYIPGKGR